MLNDTGFCGSTFWNSSLTWYTTEEPDLTRCFEKTILVLIPILYLWIFLPLEYYWLRKSLNKDVPWNWKNITKFLLISMICILNLCDFFSNISNNNNNIVKVDIYMPILKLITFITAGILLYYNKKSGIQTSGHQFLFWFLCAFCGAAQFRTEIRNFQNDKIENMFTYWTYLIYYPLVLLMLLMNFIPDDPPRINIYDRLENPTPIPGTIYLGRIFYTYFDSLLFRGFKRPVTFKDMWDLEHESESRNIIPEFEKQFQKSLAANREKFLKMQKKDANKMKIRPDNVKTIYILFKCLYPRFIFGALCKSSVDFIIYVNPQILGLLIAFVNSNEPQWKGFVYAGLMFAVGTVQSLLHNIHFINLGYFGLRARTALICSIYKKALRISNATRKDKTAGEIVNLMAVDGERFAEFSFLLPLLWSTPTQITLGIYFLWQEVGIASLAGVAVLIFLIPINVYIVRKTRTLQYQQMREKDERIKVMNEILNGIKVLKLYAWELSFEKLVQSIRMKEIKTLLKAAYLHAVSQFVWNCAPFLVAFVTFLMYVLIDENNVLDASKAFVSLALINLLRAPMNQIPLVFNSIVQTLVSFKRIDSFMNAEELEPYVEHDDEAEDPLVILNGTFSWGDDSPSSSVLKNINLTSSQNSITAIVGPVGSGKSSLMSALLGEMHKKSGKVNVNGTLAYVPQQAWIQNCSVRENIVFGKSFDKIKYNKVISACALEPDLKMLADGDSTEIGENGINLSGGQKQRISLARAVYDDADIYLFDDPLSAVDSHVGKHIFTHLIGPNGLLSGKVRVLVTHAVTYLPKTDRIFVLKDGKIQESGTYKELLSNRGAFADFLMQHIGEEVSDEEELDEIEKQIAATPLAKELKTKISRQRSQLSQSSSCIENINLTRTESLRSLRSVHSYQLASVESWKNISEKKLQENFEGILSLQEEKFKTDAIKGRGKLIDAEKTEKGLVKLAVFKYYFSAVGFLRISGTFLFYIGFQGFLLGSSIWLGQWAEDTNITDKNGRVNTGLRDMYIYVYGALGLAQGICIFSANILFARGATGAATKLHKSLINSVLRLPIAFFDVTPIGRILARFSSDIISVDMRLPGEVNNILSHSLKILGTFVIICYTTPLFTLVLIPILILYVFIQRYFITTTRQIKRLESVSKSPIYTHFSETISGTVVIRAYKCEQEFIEEFERRIDGNQKCRYAAVFANRWLGVRLETIGNLIVLTSALFAVLNKNVNASMVGLSISYSLQITQTLSMLVRAMSDCEASVVSVERIKEYSEVKQEKPWTIPKNKPQQFWPDNGNVKFNDFSVRYRTGLDLVLHGVNFSVNGGEKIGIVGRTGAGKSSLTLSLFRIIEGSAGKIYIDDVDISELGLHDLRSKLTIIPQDAVLFSGTLRLNLDPFESYSDEEVWRSVELAHLKKFVSSLPEGLYHRVSEGGVNLSIGQRQLICLARALLRKTKILILDEATAAVDLETDDLIQKTIREEFHDCTIITIAHRLNTIMDSNRVLVLDRGQIAEFDTPKVLLSNRRSIFYGMCKDAGLAN